MCRNFLPTSVPRPVVDDLLDLARRAPSAGHTQGWEFLVLDTPDATARLWEATFPQGVPEAFPWPGLFHAPVVVIPHADRDAYDHRYAEPDKLGAKPEAEFWPIPFWFLDTGFATMTLLLAAEDRGLGALFFGIFPEHLDRFRRAFRVPDHLVPVGGVAIGHPAPDGRSSNSARRGRRPVEEVVHHGAFADPLRWRAGPRSGHDGGEDPPDPPGSSSP